MLNSPLPSRSIYHRLLHGLGSTGWARVQKIEKGPYPMHPLISLPPSNAMGASPISGLSRWGQPRKPRREQCEMPSLVTGCWRPGAIHWRPSMDLPVPSKWSMRFINYCKKATYIFTRPAAGRTGFAAQLSGLSSSLAFLPLVFPFPFWLILLPVSSSKRLKVLLFFSKSLMAFT